ncbi:MAG: acid phosphatase [Planctomycetes bacterium]|nr:acid phosphatase [Planctomycetota bacterium]
MSRFVAALVMLGAPLALIAARLDDGARPRTAWPARLPVYDHVVIVVEENKDYEEIIGNPKAPFINKLRREGANFTRMFAEEHFSQGNYFWLFSGGNQNVGFVDEVPSKANHPNYPFQSKNLAEQLIKKGLSFKGYAEDLPAIGSTVELTRNKDGVEIYARKHVPWISFANVPNGTTAATSCNLRFADFPRDAAGFRTLPTVAFVIPNLENDMHNGEPRDSIPRGDRWLRDNLDAYYQWAKKNNSLLIVTFDENNDKRNYRGLTNPFVEPKNEFLRDLQNRIATILAGAHIKAGDFAEGKGVTHVNILRTLEAMYGLKRCGAQQPNAAGGGIRDDYLITDVFAERR